MASANIEARGAIAQAASSFVEGVRFANAGVAERAVLRTGRAIPVGPVVELGDRAVAQVVFYPARVQATVEGKPVFAEKVAPVVGIEVARTITKNGKESIEIQRHPYNSEFKGTPEEIVHALGAGVLRKAV